MLPIYYINTDLRSDRRGHMEGQFHRLGLQATRIEATTPDDVPLHLVAKYCSDDSPVRHGINHLACAMSHYEAWRVVRDGDAPAALILEDDALLSPDLPRFLAQLGDALPDGIDLLKLDTALEQVRLSSQVERLAGTYTSARLFGSHMGACGYIISRPLAAHLLADPERFDLPLDVYLFGRRGRLIFQRRVCQLDPALAIQLSDHQPATAAAASDLAAERKGGQQPVVSPDRWLRLRQRLMAALMDARYFGYDLRGLFGPRRLIRFAESPSMPSSSPSRSAHA